MKKPAEPQRKMCYQCHKPQATCICSLCKTVENKTHILILQHARERHHPIGTARIALQTLANIQRLVAWKSLPKPDLLPNCALLYPGPNSRPMEELAPHEAPDQLIVLDGTWPHAQVLYRNNAWLQQLPQVSLHPLEPSQYRIRAEPKAAYISTIESIILALRILEPHTPNLDNPLHVFQQMIDDQIRLTIEHTGSNPF